jgi:C-terminal processing protease CtpA/Prc
MRKILPLILILTFALLACQPKPNKNDTEFDNGSRIELTEATPQQLENMALLGKVWGFLKYYHPNVAKGNYDWDYELFRIMPAYLAAETNTKRDEILLNWITTLGAFKTDSKPDSLADENVKMKPDLEWINAPELSPKLRNKLQEVKMAKRNGKNCYVLLSRNVGNPNLQNEKQYPSMTYPDAGFRILALYRYWNIIQYYFPYRYLIGRDWHEVLREYLPIFIAAGNEVEYKLAMLRLFAEVNDSHAQYYGTDKTLANYFGDNYVPVRLSFIEDSAVVTDYYHPQFFDNDGLKVGDILVSVDGKSIEKIVEEMIPFNSASNLPTKLRNISSKILRSRKTTMEVEIMRNGMRLSKSLKTVSFDSFKKASMPRTDTCFKMIETHIAYIHNGALKKKYVSDIWETFKESKGLILDLRNYPSDFPIFDLGNLLVSSSVSFVKFTNGNLRIPGYFSFTKSLSVGFENANFYKGKVVILVNEQTQSSAEYHAMAYQKAPNVTVIGSTTAGADGNVSFFYLPGGIKTCITGIGVYYPDGTETQRVGIVPDIVVKPTIQGIREGRDELVEKAIEIINQ